LTILKSGGLHEHHLAAGHSCQRLVCRGERQYRGLHQGLFEAGKAAVEVCLYLVGIVSLWLGITKILEDSGLMYKLSRFFTPVISSLFKNIPAGHSSITSITLNLLANFLASATPPPLWASKPWKTFRP
jgi:spore maturation protein A